MRIEGKVRRIIILNKNWADIILYNPEDGKDYVARLIRFHERDYLRPEGIFLHDGLYLTASDEIWDHLRKIMDAMPW